MDYHVSQFSSLATVCGFFVTFDPRVCSTLQQRLEQSITETDAEQPGQTQSVPDSPDKRQVELLKSEVDRMRYLLESTQHDHEEKMQLLVMEEKHMKEENTRLRRRLQQEAERREEICRNLSESESSLEIDTER